VLASESDEIVERSILEFEYHADMARWMGYGASWHDHGFKINVHLSGKGVVKLISFWQVLFWQQAFCLLFFWQVPF
jgi:UV DNA damage endonuclease